MANNNFVPLSYYLSPNLFGFIEIPDNFLDDIGISASRVETQTTIIEGTEETFSETFIDEQGEEVTVEWIETQAEQNTSIIFSIANSQELAFKIPALEGTELVITSTEAPGASPFTVSLTQKNDGSFVFGAGISFKLRFGREVLKPMVLTDVETTTFEEDTDIERVEIEIGFVELSIDAEGFHFEAEAGFEITQPVMIADTGVILHQLTGITINLTGSDGSRPENAPADWRGFYIDTATIYIPDVMGGCFTIQGLGIGSGGLYGRIAAEWPLTYYPDREEGKRFAGSDLAGSVMGMEGGISSIALEFVQCIPVEADIRGKILFPFFEEPVDVCIGIGIDGDFQLTLADTDEDGIYRLKREKLLEATLESVTFEKQEDRFIASLAGSIKPLVGEVDWPEFEVKQLAVDSEGNVHLDGGWIDVPDKFSFDFHGFKIEVSEVGFGTEEIEGAEGTVAWKWIGFSGGIQIVEGVEAGASVEGLKIKWTETGDIDVELKGIGVEFEIPDVLKFDGTVAFFDENNLKGFLGDIHLNLMAIGLEFDAIFLAGRNTELPPYNFCFLYLDVELPAGIPLGCSGAGLYGLAGLFGYNVEPNKGLGNPEEEWYGDADTPGWYKREPEGVTSVSSDPTDGKWSPQRDSLAIGAGVTLGTITDNGYLVSAKTLLVIVIPGPIILIEGKANFLKERSTLSEEGIFKALAVIDNRAGQFTLNIEAAYKYDEEEGRVLDIHGGAEAFFDYHDTNNWHLYLGEKEPKEKRIAADIIRIFEANVYFMLEPTYLAWGFWFGFDEKWELGPVRIVAAAWAEGGVEAAWKPEQFWGKVWLHGELGIKVFWFEFGLYLDAGIEGNTPTPYYVLIALKFGINLPSPIPDIELGFDLKWEDEGDLPWPIPLQDVAIGHELIQENILLSKVLPEGDTDFDEDEDGFVDDPSHLRTAADGFPASPPLPGDLPIPIVPLDARPLLTFGKPVSDTAGVGDNAYPLEPAWQAIGCEGEDESLKEYAYKFELVFLLLEKQVESHWQGVAYRGSGLPDPPDRLLYGTWLPVEDGVGHPTQTKLQLWTKTPFAYTRYTTRDYTDAFIEDNPDYPCIPTYAAQIICVDFDTLSPGTIPSSLTHQEITIDTGWPFEVVAAQTCYPGDLYPSDSLAAQYRQSLSFKEKKTPYAILISFPEAVCWLNIKARSRQPITVTSLDRNRNILAEENYDSHRDISISFGNQDCSEATCQIQHIAIRRTDERYGGTIDSQLLCLFEICYLPASECAKQNLYGDYSHRSQLIPEHWYMEGNILEPYTTYRLLIKTQVSLKENQEETARNENQRSFYEYAFFRTQGPPGFINLEKNIPSGEPGTSIPQEHPLNRLDLYIKQTIPADQAPFYRAYDVRIEFNQNYVELMYRIAKHDLGIYLFDNNGQQVRDAYGRIINFSHTWNKAADLELSPEAETYREQLNHSPCLNLDEDLIPRNDILANAFRERFLLPQTLYEARVIPMLLHETFDGGSLAGWEFVGTTITGWGIQFDTVEEQTIYYLSQTSLVQTTFAVFGEDSWQGDYRLTVVLASGTSGAIGAIFRYQNPNNYYRFSMHREERYRRLIKMKGGDVETLLTRLDSDRPAEDEWIYEENRFYEVTIEALGSSIKVFLGGELIFDVIDQDSDMVGGQIALYCGSNSDARFYDVMLEDLSEQAKTVYSFPFVTSRYANFYHHVHSFNDRLGPTVILDTDPEGRSFEESLGAYPEVINLPERVELRPVERAGRKIGFLMTGPEPMAWERITPTVKRNNSPVDLGIPGTVKLTQLSHDSVTTQLKLILRENLSLQNWRIEYTDDLQQVDWKNFYTFKGCELLSKINLSTEDFSSLPPAEGFYYVTGDITWRNYRLTGDFEVSSNEQEAGILFRYYDANHYYKLSVSNSGRIALIKQIGDETILLGPNEDIETERFFRARDVLIKALVYRNWMTVAEAERIKRYRLTIEVEGANISIFFNGERCFTVEDTDPLLHGCVGAFFLLPGVEAKFNELSVRSLDKQPLPKGQIIQLEISNLKSTEPLPEGESVFNESLIPDIMLGAPHSRGFRILDDKGTTIHKRSFGNSVGETVPIRVIPSPDGTAALLLAEGGTVIEREQRYSLQLTFSKIRNGLPILKQWGDDADEVATIEFKSSNL
jgi:hypothetical protein